MLSDDTLTGARLVAVGEVASLREHIRQYRQAKWEDAKEVMEDTDYAPMARAAIRAQAEAAGVTADKAADVADRISSHLLDDAQPVAALLRALAGVLRDAR